MCRRALTELVVTRTDSKKTAPLGETRSLLASLLLSVADSSLLP
jgi:hypothetical protein